MTSSGRPPNYPHLMFLFLDGVGAGNPADPNNPLSAIGMPASERILGDRIFHPGHDARPAAGVSVAAIDANLGIEGLPQSGTAQTAILTGHNAPALLGRHFGPYPHSALRSGLEENNLFRRLSLRGLTTAYLNAFPKQYFAYLERHPNLSGAFPTAWRMAGNKLNTEVELISGRALSADITSEAWLKLGYPDVPVVSPEEASGVVLRVLDETDFVLFEYYLTDHAGHGRRGAKAEAILPGLDRFIGSLAERTIAAGHTLVITSDHGNLEDLSRTTHTRNPVPFISAGAFHDSLAGRLSDLTDILPAIEGHFERFRRPG